MCSGPQSAAVDDPLDHAVLAVLNGKLKAVVGVQDMPLDTLVYQMQRGSAAGSKACTRGLLKHAG